MHKRYAHIVTLALAAALLLPCCIREPELHLHRDKDIDIALPVVELELAVYWNYEDSLGIPYDWEEEWYYGWDDTDLTIFGEMGYVEPGVFNLRRYYTGDEAHAAHTSVLSDIVDGYYFSDTFDWGFWDILAWNDISTIDGVQSLIFDESSLDSVMAYTNQTIYSTRYQAPKYTRSFYQPEGLFSAYEEAIELNSNLDDFVYDDDRDVWVKTINMVLLPRTYIYLTQVILHHNSGKIVSIDGNADLSGMARSVNLTTGYASTDAVTVYYNARMKDDCSKDGETVDIIGGRLMTFGLCGIDANEYDTSVTQSVDDGVNHYMDVTMQFNNGLDSTFVFNVTDQVRRRYKGGVITVELDMDTIPVPSRSTGSGFDAVVVDYEDGGTHEFGL